MASEQESYSVFWPEVFKTGTFPTTGYNLTIDRKRACAYGLMGWGESCAGSLTIKSESLITIKEEITTPESYLIGLINNDSGEDIIQNFIDEFFPKGRPVFEVQTLSTTNDKYLYNQIFINGKYITKIFKSKESSGQVFQAAINGEKV